MRAEQGGQEGKPAPEPEVEEPEEEKEVVEKDQPMTKRKGESQDNQTNLQKKNTRGPWLVATTARLGSWTLRLPLARIFWPLFSGI